MAPPLAPCGGVALHRTASASRGLRGRWAATRQRSARSCGATSREQDAQQDDSLAIKTGLLERPFARENIEKRGRWSVSQLRLAMACDAASQVQDRQQDESLVVASCDSFMLHKGDEKTSTCEDSAIESACIACESDYNSDEEVLSVACSEDWGVRGAIRDTVDEEVTLMCNTVLQAITPKVTMGRIRPQSKPESTACTPRDLGRETEIGQSAKTAVIIPPSPRTKRRVIGQVRRTSSTPVLPPFPQTWKPRDLSLDTLSAVDVAVLDAHLLGKTAANDLIGRTSEAGKSTPLGTLKDNLIKEFVAKEEAEDKIRTLRNRIQKTEVEAAKTRPPRVPAASSRCQMSIRLDSYEDQDTDVTHASRDSSIERSYTVLGTEFHHMATPTAVSQAPLILEPSSFWV